MGKKCKSCKKIKTIEKFRRRFSGKYWSKCNMCLDGISDEVLGTDKKFTYLVINLENNLVKIGRSNLPVNRIRTLKREYPFIKLLGYVDGDIEQYLHKKFNKERQYSKWFKISMEEVRNIIKEYGFYLNDV